MGVAGNAGGRSGSVRAVAGCDVRARVGCVKRGATATRPCLRLHAALAELHASRYVDSIRQRSHRCQSLHVGIAEAACSNVSNGISIRIAGCMSVSRTEPGSRRLPALPDHRQLSASTTAC
jgi:hypothetical protein